MLTLRVGPTTFASESTKSLLEKKDRFPVQGLPKLITYPYLYDGKHVGSTLSAGSTSFASENTEPDEKDGKNLEGKKNC